MCLGCVAVVLGLWAIGSVWTGVKGVVEETLAPSQSVGYTATPGGGGIVNKFWMDREGQFHQLRPLSGQAQAGYIVAGGVAGVIALVICAYFWRGWRGRRAAIVKQVLFGCAATVLGLGALCALGVRFAGKVPTEGGGSRHISTAEQSGYGIAGVIGTVVAFLMFRKLRRDRRAGYEANETEAEVADAGPTGPSEGAGVAAPVAVASTDDIPAKLKQLADLKDQGVISQEEFNDKKRELLDRM